MASQKDVQDLLRLLTTGRNKLPMMEAMGRIKALQTAGLKSITTIAGADLPTLTTAIKDEKAAKQLLAAAKSSIKDTSKKRSSSDTLASPEPKRKKTAYELDAEPPTPQALEASLALPTASSDEAEISQTTIYTNRAPLVLAFAVQLLKYTMPEQPLSSRLSLAQAVVSANSRSKAVSLGIEKGASAEQDGWGSGQPKVRILGREVFVLKRGGYEWRGAVEPEPESAREEVTQESESTVKEDVVVEQNGRNPHQVYPTDGTPKWTVSQGVTLKQSTFVARSIGIKSAAQAKLLRQELLAGSKELRDASHNVTVWRVKTERGDIIEHYDDDGETGGGQHILKILQSLDLVGVMVVMTRWYGGILLYNDRWRLMSQVTQDALSQRMRISGSVGQEALWGLDLEGMRSTNAPVTGGTAAGMPIYKSESARSYIMKAFASAPTDGTTKKKSGVALEREKEHNLGLLLGALDKLFASWVEHVGSDELDRKAWTWYVQVRPDVESGVAGWGGKGEVKLKDILDLRRKG